MNSMSRPSPRAWSLPPARTCMPPSAPGLRAHRARHGGATARAYAFLRQARHASDLAWLCFRTLATWRRVPGFGHALYPDGDPRGTELFAQILQRPHLPAKLSTLRALVEQVETLTGQHPNIDLMLAAIIEAHELDASAALALFAAGRVAGWLAHALEQQGQSSLIRHGPLRRQRSRRGTVSCAGVAPASCGQSVTREPARTTLAAPSAPHHRADKDRPSRTVRFPGLISMVRAPRCRASDGAAAGCTTPAVPTTSIRSQDWLASTAARNGASGRFSPNHTTPGGCARRNACNAADRHAPARHRPPESALRSKAAHTRSSDARTDRHADAALRGCRRVRAGHRHSASRPRSAGFRPPWPRTDGRRWVARRVRPPCATGTSPTLLPDRSARLGWPTRNGPPVLAWRNVAMPLSADMPAPLSTTIERAWRIRLRVWSRRAVSGMAGSPVGKETSCRLAATFAVAQTVAATLPTATPHQRMPRPLGGPFQPAWLA